MPFNINAFKDNIDSYGYLKNNSFEVLVFNPPVLQNSSINNQGTPVSLSRIGREMKFRIEQVRLPGITLMSADVNRYGVGPTQKMPYNAQFQETTFSILCDGYGEIYQFWYNWMRSIFEFNGVENASTGQANRIPRYNTEYKVNYSTPIQIVIYDPYGNAVQKINLYEAFPTSIRDIQLSWGDSGLMRLAVSITYSEYTIVGNALQSNYQQPLVMRNNSQLSTTQIISN